MSKSRIVPPETLKVGHAEALGDDTLTLTLRSVDWLVVDGPDQGRHFRTDAEPVRFGTAPDNTVVLSDPRASRLHAEVQTQAQGFLVRDLGSTNGTYLDGHRIKEAYLKPGGRLRFGTTTIEFQPRSDNLVIPPSALDRFGSLRGQSVPMRQLFGALRRVAQSDVTVLLLGETGTGKELAARSIHDGSRRAAKSMVVLDCSAVDRELVSSEIFGHEAGAFTGARADRAGAFEQAQGSTLFLDEIGELPLDLQAKLLRALETGEVRRLGSNKAVRVDCRVIAATHRDLEAQVAAGQFREDLYYRLAKLVLRIPALRERPEDVPFLADAFLSELCTAERTLAFSPAARAALESARFPGNVRQLRNAVERAFTMAPGPLIGPDDLGLIAGSSMTGLSRPRPAAALAGQIEDTEREAILRALKTHGYNRVKAAAELGISRMTLRERMRRFAIKVPERGEPEAP